MNLINFPYKKLFLTFLMYIALLPIAMISIALGAYNMPLKEVFRCLLSPWNSQGETSIAYTIMWQYRVPRTLAAMLTGATFAFSGAVIQGVTRNPLASPFTLGISTAASFGAAITIIAGVKVLGLSQTIFSTTQGFAVIAAAALLFSFIQTAIVLTLAYLKGLSPESIVLMGIATTYIYSAGITFLQYFAGETQLREYVHWVIGDLMRVDWSKIPILVLVFVVTVSSIVYLAWDLNALSLGDDVAKNLGVNPKRVRLLASLLSSIATAIVVSITGPIAFVCLMAPHMARLFIGSDNRYLLPLSMAMGSALLTLSDTVARIAMKPVELPVGAVTSLLGALFFVSLYLAHRRRVVMSF
ncbi:iron ABC transporter permease [Ignisphaera sp. 4213-co]|uniref:Iron ABC transporter permease n=1 Tax=Ignisphaera cupida TaxID=3050454 RepID=A0ABD4Z7S0_9CREN|nr:iron ABC transporter permease [Ignisphaera sp. 4213-co]MDK6028920.1 iron ABC transporter permease [Ignisphaera sp. 4213-co]